MAPASVETAPPGQTLELTPRIRIVGTMLGQVASRRRGRSSDVAGSRPYVPGDDIRTIDWAASARLSAASQHEQLVVREFHAEEAPTIVVALDASASMQRFPADLPWLHKPDAVAACLRVLAGAAAAGRSQLGVMGSDEWLPPRHRLAEDVRLPAGGGALSLDALFEMLCDQAHLLPPGTFVFHVSDVAEPVTPALLDAYADLEWQLVPLVVRDPVWEQSYPVETGGVSLPVEGEPVPRRHGRRGAHELREAHERELQELLATFERHGFPAVVVGTADDGAVVGALLAWCEAFAERQ